MSTWVRGIRTFGLSIVGALALANAVSAGGPPSTFIVDSVLDAIDDNTGDGACHAAIGKCTLRAAVMQANVMTSTSTIVLPAGIYALTILPSGTGADPTTGDLDLTTGADIINISGSGAATTIIDADLIVDRAITVQPGRTASISGVTVRNGQPTGFGGGIWNRGTLTVSYSTLSGNWAGAGGGIQTAGDLTLSHCTVSGNHAQFGGGVATGFGTLLHMSQCTISGNEATQDGGGFQNVGNLYVTNSTISGNSSYDDGGGIWSNGSAHVYNSTIVFNGANTDADFDSTSGGGVFNAGGSSFGLVATVVAGNKVFGGSIDNDCVGSLDSYGRNKFGTEAGCTVVQFGAGGHMLLGSLSELGPLQFNGGSTQTRALVTGSGMIDGVEPTFGCVDDQGTLVIDQRGGARGAGALCDIGAFEFNALQPGLIFADGFELGNLWAWG